MKKIIIIGITFIFSSVAFNTIKAQLHVNVNIGVQPLWGPVGYDYAEYYYMPDIDVFYSVPRRQYIYMDGGRWVYVRTLPARYRSYDLYSGYKVVINDDRMPYRHADRYRVQYAPYKGRHDQVIIRNSNDSRYYGVKGHPGHDKWEQEQRWNQNKGGKGHKGGKKH